MAIAFVGRVVPADYQLFEGLQMRVWLPTAVQGDLHVAHVGHPGTTTVTASLGWQLVDHVTSGAGLIDTSQDIWISPVGASPAAFVDFTFSAAAGEKWVGVLTLRGVDLDDPIAGWAEEIQPPGA